MPARLEPGLEAVYGAYSADWLSIGEAVRHELADESLYLATLLAELLPTEPEVLGLTALLCLSMARAPARGDGTEYVPLDEQDPSVWDRRLLAVGERYLHRAHAAGRVGRFQLEAAIQSAHCARLGSGSTDWAELLKLHRALVRLSPTLGARTALAACAGRATDPQAGLDVLDGITDHAIQGFQPAWATRAQLLADVGRAAEAVRAWKQAISLTTDAGVRRYLERRMAEVDQGS